MTDTKIPFGSDATKTAQNLLAAAHRLGEPASVVRTNSKGQFVVPEKVAKEADSYSKGGPDKPAKKAPAKKAAAKKAPAKKAAKSSEAKPAADTTEAQE